MRDEQLLAKANRINLLLDCYGHLLTEKQLLFLRLQFAEDFSLSEIAEQYHVSRQAVNDHIKRASELLEEYERKLQVLRKHHERAQLLDNILAKIQERPLDEHTASHIKQCIMQIKALDEG